MIFATMASASDGQHAFGGTAVCGAASTDGGEHGRELGSIGTAGWVDMSISGELDPSVSSAFCDDDHAAKMASASDGDKADEW